MSPNSTLIAHLSKSKSRVESWPTWKQEQSGTNVKRSNSPTAQQREKEVKESAIAY
ncbi:hypothetical protein [Photobacterium indicum]|uniref:hypothetical protein n=1 Tax=Photobacterium indicum TaxID=81447 RepID=UPI003D096A76